MEQIKDFDLAAEKFMSGYLKKPTLIKGIIHLLLILYAARVAPRPPKAVLDLFENQYFKLFFFSLILWTAQFSPSTSLLIAISFMVTMNYFNKKALWEFMENTEASSTPIAPSKEVALETSTAIIETQVQQPDIVQSMTQTPETIVVQPTIVETPEGQTVQNPTVVIAPAVVSNEQGEKILVKPEVTVIEVPTQASQEPTAQAPAQEAQPAPTQDAAVSAVSALAEGAASEQPTAPQQVAELTQVATAAVTTTQAAEAVEKLAQQAVKPEAAPVEAVKETAMAVIQEIMAPVAPAQQIKEEAGCYPIRRYDMSKVSAYSSNDFYGTI